MNGAAPISVFIACAPGVEPLLAAEVAGLDLGRPRAVPGGVTLEGGLGAVHRANLELGLALRVLVRVGRFPARNPRELEARARALPWERWLAPGVALDLRVRCRKSRLYHTGLVAERVRAGITARLGAAPTALAEGQPRARLQVRLDHDRCTVSADTSGAALHRRGYRLATGKAPLREDLARLLLVASGWDRDSPLIDPFCGAGTIAIEAARWARGIPPGWDRRFAFEDAPGHDPAAWAAARAAAEARIRPSAPPVLASDRDPGAVEATRANAARAGVAADIEVRQAPLGRSALAASLPADPGAVVTNPPWGRRVSARGKLRPLYGSLGRHLAALGPRWGIALAVGDPGLARALDLHLERALTTDAGGAKVQLLTRAARRGGELG
ncbi:MAG: RNA methyltransferase [Proteobacteria bacterium]|nr:MAG: RNA methyltransferase [Pseudomonadota bacterium]